LAGDHFPSHVGKEAKVAWSIQLPKIHKSWRKTMNDYETKDSKRYQIAGERCLFATFVSKRQAKSQQKKMKIK